MGSITPILRKTTKTTTTKTLLLFLFVFLIVVPPESVIGFSSVSVHRSSNPRVSGKSPRLLSSSSSTGSSKKTTSTSSSGDFLVNTFLNSSPASATSSGSSSGLSLSSSPWWSSSSTTSLTNSYSDMTRPNECDDSNHPPSLNILLRTLQQLTRGSGSTDIRGRFVDHKRVGSVASVAHEIGRHHFSKGGGGGGGGTYAPLTPFAAYCLGFGFAQFVLQQQNQQQSQQPQPQPITILLGQDPRPHGQRLADAFARGAEHAGRPKKSVVQTPEPSHQEPSSPLVQVLYTGIATTPGCAALSGGTLQKATASVMVTASHLPIDRNGFKLFHRGTCLTYPEIALVGNYAAQFALEWYTHHSLLPPTSGDRAVMCSSWVDYMPDYAASLKQAIQREVNTVDSSDADSNSNKCLEGLTLVVNAGHGSGGFFSKVLHELGANVAGSIGIEPDETFPLGIPNPEYQPMIEATIQACQTVQADLGIMLDTDSDRCGFVVPTTTTKKKNDDNSVDDGNDDNKIRYEPLNRNRLIAMMGVILSQTTTANNNNNTTTGKHNTNCAIVTDSVTSEGLSIFLQEKLGLTHVRYLKGYQNVIDKAKELTETGVLNAELAMETSGHGAMKENNYLDDGTYTAVKIVSLLARQQQQQSSNSSTATTKISLLDLIRDLDEQDVIRELRFSVVDESFETMRQVFDFCALEIENLCLNRDPSEAIIISQDDNDEDVSETATATTTKETNDEGNAMIQNDWSLDTENLEGIRVRIGQQQKGQFFMLRKSLHDPIISLQIEASSQEAAQKLVIDPLLQLFESETAIQSQLDLSVLRDFA